jgi:N-acyl-D-aspartate/D-glutamate deacylase
MTDMLIKNGTVVDGTGGPSYPADVRVRNGLIAEIGVDLQPQGERVFDATGCKVTPGFIEAHTHYDGSMWWQPDLDPLPGYGTTTMIMGNCGFSAAPLHPDKAIQREMIGIFSFFEDIPEQLFLKHMPWDWLKWSEYKAAMDRQVRVPINYATYVGHIALRLAVMGIDAWSRKATPDEIAAMADLLDDALAAGALGLSCNLMDHDGSDRPVPSLSACDDELTALFDVIERYPAATYQVIVDVFMRMTGPQSMDRLERLLKGRSIRLQVAGGLPLLEFQKKIREPMEARMLAMQEAGIDIWPTAAHVPITSVIGLIKSLLFAQSNDYVWHEVVLAETHEEKAGLLADPDWRARARDSWDNKIWKQSALANPQNLLLIDSENGTGPINISLQTYADERGLHASDALADWMLANGTRSTIHMAPWPKDEDRLIELLHDPRSVGNISDAGAHLQMLCGGGENALLLTHYARDAKLISLEQAVHVLTGKLAGYFNLHDRGTIEVGKRADIVVFDLDEIQRRQMEKVYDLDDGKGGLTWRFSRKAMPARLTLVNGVPTFEGGAYTGAVPGEFLAPKVEAREFEAEPAE